MVPEEISPVAYLDPSRQLLTRMLAKFFVHDIWPYLLPDHPLSVFAIQNEIHCSSTEKRGHTVEYSRTIESPQEIVLENPSCRYLYSWSSVD